MPARRFPRRSEIGIEHGWRSGLEKQEADRLKSLGVEFTYETYSIPWTPLKIRRSYKPDFTILRNYIVIESKGRFLTADRQKHLAVQKEYPDLDLRFVFSNANARIGKKSKTTYAMWCESHGFQWAHKTTPQSWLSEPLNTKSRDIITRFIRGEIK